MYAAEREQHRRAYIAVAGKRLAELSLVLDQPGTETYQRAIQSHLGSATSRRPT